MVQAKRRVSASRAASTTSFDGPLLAVTANCPCSRRAKPRSSARNRVRAPRRLAPATVSAQGLVTTHRISAAVASELVAGAVAACKEQIYNVTAVVLDIDGVRQAMLRGDGAGIATLEVANDKAFTSISTRTDTGVLVERAKTTPPSQFLLKVPHMLLLQGAIVIKTWRRDGRRPRGQRRARRGKG